MEKKFKLGDHVIIAAWSTGYNKKYRGYYGVVKHVAVRGKYGIELDGFRNSRSETGLFWFNEQDLVMQKDEKTVLIGDMKNGYSYVTPKEVEEMRMKIDREKIKEVEEMRMKNDIEKIEEAQNMLTKMFLNSEYAITIHKDVEIVKVIFNNPATIVFWSDGKKTVVQCSSDEAFDEEKGLAMAISKRVLGNKGNYYNEFKKWLPTLPDVVMDDAAETFRKFGKALRKLKGDE